MVQKVANMCHKRYNTSLLDCVKERSLIGLDTMYRSKNEISLIPNFISLVRNEDHQAEERSGKMLLADIAGSENAQNRSLILDNLIVRKAYDFFASRSVSFKIPVISFDIFSSKDSEEEGKS